MYDILYGTKWTMYNFWVRFQLNTTSFLKKCTIKKTTFIWEKIIILMDDSHSSEIRDLFSISNAPAKYFKIWYTNLWNLDFCLFFSCNIISPPKVCSKEFLKKNKVFQNEKCAWVFNFSYSKKYIENLKVFQWCKKLRINLWFLKSLPSFTEVFLVKKMCHGNKVKLK